MSKVIKLKQSDIEKIVESVISENNQDTEVTPDNQDSTGKKANVIFAVNPETQEVYVVKDPESDNPTIVNTGKKLK